MRRIFFAILLLFSFAVNHAQVVYTHVSNANIYEFLDELAAIKVIEINSVVKPYSRIFIAQKLKEANAKSDQLNKRQKDELAFYLKDYNKEISVTPKKDYIGKELFCKMCRTEIKQQPEKKRLDLFHYKDSLFSFTINPILGIKYYTNSNGNLYHSSNGAEAFAYLGKHFGLYSSLRDNHESKIITTPDYLTQETGFGKKESDKTGTDYSEMRGGITWSNEYMSIGMIKDHFVWGDNYNGSNIFSGKSPSFAQINWNVHPAKWFEFNYVHGWLASGIIDSSSSYSYSHGMRYVYRQKNLSANMFTFIPWKQFHISLGNSIIYSDMGSNPAYYIPVFFYKSLDHTYVTSNFGGSNAQMFFNISSRNIKGVHLYTSWYVDEIHIANMWDKDKQSNFISAKAGFRVSKIKNISLIAEYTRSNPMVYKHFIPTTTFASNDYNLGHYLRDNAQEQFFCIRYKPIRGLTIDLSYVNAQKGEDYEYTGVGGSGLGLPFLDSLAWKNETYDIKVQYEFINDGIILAEFSNSFINGDIGKYTPEFMWGRKNTFIFGLNFGF